MKNALAAALLVLSLYVIGKVSYKLFKPYKIPMGRVRCDAGRNG